MKKINHIFILLAYIKYRWILLWNDGQMKKHQWKDYYRIVDRLED